MTIFKKSLALTFFALLLSLSACTSSDTKESTGQYIDNSVLTAQVKTAIFNEPTLKSSEITVETFKGRVQLGGFVSSTEQTYKAVEVAKAISGVTSVSNNIRVRGNNYPFYK